MNFGRSVKTGSSEKIKAYFIIIKSFFLFFMILVLDS